MTKICENCIYCKRLFQRFGYEMNPKNYFLCKEKDNFTELKNTCNGWQQKNDIYDLSPARFEQAEREIKAIIEILKQ
ncbi:MAG: hypothetical protein HDP28_02155 [Clostridia bacterium]|nr:hypothetical protein [Clostridia bacterium]